MYEISSIFNILQRTFCVLDKRLFGYKETDHYSIKLYKQMLSQDVLNLGIGQIGCIHYKDISEVKYIDSIIIIIIESCEFSLIINNENNELLKKYGKDKELKFLLGSSNVYIYYIYRKLKY